MANRSYITVDDLSNPQLGDICHGRDLGYTSTNGYTVYLYTQCPRCNDFRWAIKKRLLKSKTGLCRKCFYETWSPPRRPKGKYKGENSPSWHGGRINYNNGYKAIRIYEDDFFWSMAIQRECNAGYILEHRLVMAKHLGRCLHSWEIVHHKHTKYPSGSIEDKQDNRIENLQLVSDDRHKQITILENRIQHLEKRVIELEAEVILLKTNMVEVSNG